MSICITEYRSRMGCHHSRAITPKKSKHKTLLSVGEAYILMLVLCYGNIGILIALLTIVLQDTILCNYISSYKTSYDMSPGKYKEKEYLHFLFTDYISILLILANDIESNPGPLGNVSKDLSICHINSQSLFNKVDLIAAELGTYDIVTVSETWLDSSIESNDIKIPNFQMSIRLDRNRRGGEVAAYFRTSVPFIERPELLVQGVEAVWAEVVLNKKRLLVGTFYIHPRFEDWDLVKISIEQAILCCENTIIIGDFNENMLNPRQCKNIKSIMDTFSLTQLVMSPTRITETSETLIDIALVSENLSCSDRGIIEPFCSDHCGIHISTSFMKLNNHCYKRKVWKYEDANFDLYREKLGDFDWDCEDLTIDESAAKLTQNILQSADVSIPNKIVTIRPRDPPWMHNGIRRAIRDKNKKHKIAKSVKTYETWARYRHARNIVTELVRDAKTNFFKKLATSLHQGNLNSKQWWKITKQFLKQSNDSDIPLIIHNGEHHSSSIDKANIINDYFSTQSTVDDTHATLPPLNPSDTVLSEIVVSEQDVNDVLKLIDGNKACGPDLVSPKLLKDGATVLTPHLCKIFNISLVSSIFPSDWKTANVVPVHKKGDRTNTSNYRPISLISCIGKVFEKCVFKHLHNYLVSNHKLTPVQSGFTPGDSAVFQLADLCHTFSRAVDEGKEIRVVFCDISKAFDRVWHKGLLFKLRRMDISGHLLDWFGCYLNNRTQRVALEGSYSQYKILNAGVPQGSILGPLLFLIYINDIVEEIGSNIRLFADDTSLYLIVDDPDTTADLMNADLDKIHSWSQSWLVTFNPNKTEELIKSRKAAPPDHPPLYMNNTQETSKYTS